MALSDLLSKLAKQAKETEDKARAASDEAREDLQTHVKQASEAARQTADGLAARKRAGEARATDRWAEVQSDWVRHVSKVREGLASKKAAVDASAAKLEADLAEDDAEMAIDFASAAIQEAEYAVLDAILARKEADDIAVGR